MSIHTLNMQASPQGTKLLGIRYSLFPVTPQSRSILNTSKIKQSLKERKNLNKNSIIKLQFTNYSINSAYLNLHLFFLHLHPSPSPSSSLHSPCSRGPSVVGRSTLSAPPPPPSSPRPSLPPTVPSTYRTPLKMLALLTLVVLHISILGVALLTTCGGGKKKKDEPPAAGTPVEVYGRLGGTVEYGYRLVIL